ncbi:type II secretion system F family protein [Sandarakinorhabdus oryzae]|uniref:type II secretion system F family protein n=1 Tax=Sandarakinorhabdus oryzae TaxID=2675220 RepID=UPI0012E2E6D2|nr:type II secretion system F family protein [Sandarakinorhabdus oryzae]
MVTGQFANWIVLGLVFFAAVLVVLALAPMILGRTDIKARLASQGGSAAVDSGPGSIRNDAISSRWARLLQQIEERGLNLTDSASNKIAEKLQMAGFDQPWAPRAFTLARAAGTLGLPTLMLLFIAVSGNWPTPGKLYMFVMGSALLGLYAPGIIVSGRADERAKEILNGFPDTLDLLLVCLEAGLGIDAAFSRVGSEITSSHPLLAKLFGQVSLELRAGRSREAALRLLAKKSGVPEITAFTTLIIQSDKLGASVASALRIYAAEMREQRRMRAEEKAHRIPVLLSIPLVCFMLPTMVAVLMLPAAIGMKNQMATVDKQRAAQQQ